MRKILMNGPILFLSIILGLIAVVLTYFISIPLKGSYCGFEGCMNFAGFPLSWYFNGTGFAQLKLGNILLNFCFMVVICYLALWRYRKKEQNDR